MPRGITGDTSNNKKMNIKIDLMSRYVTLCHAMLLCCNMSADVTPIESFNCSMSTDSSAADKKADVKRKTNILDELLEQSDSESTKRIRRCASPSHFNLPAQQQAAYEPPHLAALPDRIKLNAVLNAVAAAYYRPAPPLPASCLHMFPASSTESNDQIVLNNLQTANPKLRHGFWAPPSTANVVEAASLFDAQGAAAAKAALDQDDQLVFVTEPSSTYRTFEMLTSTLRKPEVWDNWTLKEIALFEAAMCNFGKDFHAVQRAIKTKTASEVVDFYYMWKKSTHYQIWKAAGKPNNEVSEATEHRQKVISVKMRPFEAQE